MVPVGNSWATLLRHCGGHQGKLCRPVPGLVTLLCMAATSGIDLRQQVKTTTALIVDWPLMILPAVHTFHQKVPAVPKHIAGQQPAGGAQRSNAGEQVCRELHAHLTGTALPQEGTSFGGSAQWQPVAGACGAWPQVVGSSSFIGLERVPELVFQALKQLLPGSVRLALVRPPHHA